MINVALLGYGGIARSHRAAYEALMDRGFPIRLKALCDIDPGQFQKEVAINQGNRKAKGLEDYHLYTDLARMLESEELDTIDICLPTYLHEPYTIELLKKGYHVQCEKPMSLSYGQCLGMIEAAQQSGKGLMIGMCLRFDDQYLYLKDLVDGGTLGRVESGHFERLCSLPDWGYENWFQQVEKSGGGALDTHIHDIDIIRFIFGDPLDVSAVTIDQKMPQAGIISRLRYQDMVLSAICDWSLSKSFAFQASYRVNFEKGTVIASGGQVKVYTEEGAFLAELPGKSHMEEEIAYFADVVEGRRQGTFSAKEAAKSVHLCERLIESAKGGGRVITYEPPTALR